MNDVQALADRLAEDLQRPIGVDDRRFRALAYSSHVDGVDAVRVASILQREAPRPVTAWLTDLAVAAANEPVRVPANPDLGMAARVCVPLRFEGALLGFLWLIDEPNPLADEELATAAGYAVELGAALYRAERLESEDRERQRELLERVFGRRPGDRVEAAEELAHLRFLPPARSYAVLAACPVSDTDEAPSDPIRVRVAAAMAHLGRAAASAGRPLLHIEADAAVGIIAFDDGSLETRTDLLAAEARRHLEDQPGWSAAIGAGGARSSVRELPASYDEARNALRLGLQVPDLGPTVSWDDLGAYRTIQPLVGARDPAEVVPPSVRRLLASGDGEALAATLETFLDHAGDVRSAAAALFLHRSTLYQRLHRIERVAGVDLRCGDDRLELHLGLRLWRMTGR